MRTAATALFCLMAAAATCAAAEPPLAPTLGAVKPPRATPDVRAYLPEAPPHPRVDGARPPGGRVCFSQAETREKIATHRLSDPLRALRLGRLQGEALSARLCRWNADVFVYEIHVLRRDGRVVHVYMNAQNGEAFGNPTGTDRDQDRN